jgi:uncharacterized protein (DUF697 family)
MVKSKLSSFAQMDDEKTETILTPSDMTYDGSYIAQSDKENIAREIVHKNIWYSMGVALIPVPVFDLVCSVGVQINMIRDLSELYEIPFSKHAAKNLIYSLAGGVGSLMMGRALFFSFLKVLPGGYPIAALIANPSASAAMTYALGNIFIMHFETGGTLLNFDPKKMKGHFYTEFKDGIEYSKTVR